METYFIDAAEVLRLISKDSQRAVMKLFLDEGIVVEKIAERPGSCKDCIFEGQVGCPMWADCSTNEIYIFNHLSKHFRYEGK